MRAPDDVSAFLRRIGELVARAPVSCDAGTTAADIARLMSREGVGSVLVLADGRAIGIVTDRDLRRKIVAAARDPRTTCASELMSSPVASVPAQAFVLDALVLMTRRGIHHLAVTSEGRCVGVVSASDVMRLELPHPVALARAIGVAPSVDALKPLAADVTHIVRRLVRAGTPAYEVGVLVAELNDQLVQRVLDFTTADLAAAGDQAPVPYCWLTFGSEARREQTLRTDQDNGLVYADASPAEAAAAATYYARFAEAAVRGLVAVGFPPCPGNIMASNPTLCRPLSGWVESFSRWLDHPSPSEVLAASIHFDLRPIAGAVQLGQRLSAVIEREAPKRRVFLALLAGDVVSRPTPLTLFGRVATRRGRVDIKSAAAIPLAGAARIHALELGLREVNTVDRFRAAGARGLYTPAETTEITEAYQHVLRLRLVHQLAELDAGVAPDNLIEYRTLSRGDGLLLRDALRTVTMVQAGLRERFRTDLLGSG
jgi:CBS domain-containing protein